ncbi:uncharacterized protein BT62DRAFT_922714 [Guyanagaster necrorhizus]|uniref:Uncharacterized protein n=1 Tax=Guyanagaster necrorhizus TaxID=856835 RepID=A0A9P7VKR0_9AGAR|nr:uncharacterized protein BT62DRAFT_922714 [Guyanagaster necrorhizus MCA 3950]KAG7442287.1 hypothetical protein BT62DRAFT_922714 [Guyanagaster necrorhizus MCA 3950]
MSVPPPPPPYDVATVLSDHCLILFLETGYRRRKQDGRHDGQRGRGNNPNPTENASPVRERRPLAITSSFNDADVYLFDVLTAADALPKIAHGCILFGVTAREFEGSINSSFSYFRKRREAELDRDWLRHCAGIDDKKNYGRIHRQGKIFRGPRDLCLVRSGSRWNAALDRLVLRMEQEDHGGRINDQRVLSPLRRAPGVVLLFKMISQGFKTLSVAVKRGGIKWDPCSTATSRVWRRLIDAAVNITGGSTSLASISTLPYPSVGDRMLGFEFPSVAIICSCRLI